MLTLVTSDHIDFSLTELGASHEVVTCLLGVSAVHFAGLWIKFGEHVSVEAVIVLHEAEGRCAVWHGLELFLVYSLGSDIVVVDVVPFRKRNDTWFEDCFQIEILSQSWE